MAVVAPKVSGWMRVCGLWNRITLARLPMDGVEFEAMPEWQFEGNGVWMWGHHRVGSVRSVCDVEGKAAVATKWQEATVGCMLMPINAI
jgi:hypothetical protein